MKRYYDDAWLSENNRGAWGEGDRKGMLNEVTPGMKIMTNYINASGGQSPARLRRVFVVG